MKNLPHFITKTRATIIVLTIAVFSVAAQVQSPFTPRFNETVNGDVTMIANTTISTTPTGNYNGDANNEDFSNLVYVDIDSDPNTFNSSNAVFDNPAPSASCISVSNVYLYWAASDKAPTSDPDSDNQPNWNFNDVKLMLPGQSSYTDLTADEVIFRGRDTNFSNEPYVCFKDITSLVDLESPFGTYQIANVEGKTGQLIEDGPGVLEPTGVSGGWQIVFIYESPNLPAKNISLYDGYAHIRFTTPNVDFDFSGFQTVPNGNVSADVIFGTLEGDRSLSGDRLQFEDTSGVFQNISTSERDGTNFFNSKITRDGTPFLNRTPASQNTLGFDAGIFPLNNPNNSLIDNNQTSATMRLRTTVETYGLFLIGLTVDVWEPELNPFVVTLNSGNGSVNVGDALDFSFNIENQGNDDAINVEISAILPDQVEDVIANNLPAGVTFNFDNNTGLLEFFVVDELVEVDDPLVDVEFQFVIQDACYFLEDNCNLDFEFQFVATYNGIQNPDQQTTVSSDGFDACNLGTGEPFVVNINQPVANWLNADGDLDRTVECDDAQALIDAQALEPETDICDFTITKTSGDFVIDPDCPNSGTYTNTWSFTDACGQTSTAFTQTITIVDSTAPVLDNEASDLLLECDGSGNNDQIQVWLDSNGGASASDNCSSVTWSNDYDGTASDCSAPVLVTFIATDECGNQMTTSASYAIQDTTPPTIDTGATDLTMECDGTGNTTELNNWLSNNGGASASDSCSNVTWSNDFSALSDDCGETGSVTVTFTATDDCGNTNTTTAMFTIEDTAAPTIDTEASDVTIECDEFLGFFNSDGEGTATSINDWLSNNGGASASDSCSDITWTNNFTELSDDCGQTGSATVTFTATDDCGNSSSTTATFTVIDTTAPEIDTEASDITVECDEFLGFFNSNGEGTAISITNWLNNNGGASASDSCSDITWTNNFTGLSDDCGETGSATVTFTATDECGNASSTTATFTVIDTAAPEIDTEASDITVECDESLGFFNSDGEGTAISIDDWLSSNGGASASDECSDVTWTNNFTGLSDDCGETGSATVTFTATDECGNSSSTTATFTVIDTTAPEIDTEASDITVECDGDSNSTDLNNWLNNNGGASASDECSSVTWSNDFTELSDGCGQTGSATVTFTATDDCGNSVTTTATITVIDTTAPTVTTEFDEELSVNCSEIPNAPELEFEDACATDINVEFSETSTFDGTDNDYEIIYQWIVSDDCDNTNIYTQIIFVTNSSNVEGSNGTLCIEDAPVDLFDYLSGDYSTDGSWSVTSGDATLNGSIFDPSTVSDLGDYEFTYIDQSTCSTQAIVGINVHDDCVVLPCGSEDVIISKAVTPNGDPYNEFFEISGVEDCGFIIEVQIYNRWGAKIFESDNYQNNWSGDAKNSSFGSASKVPAGTYYYVVKLKDSGLRPFSGPIYVGTR